MENLKLEATERSPEINFEFSDLKFCIRGESYPEDVTAFYGPVMEQFTESITDIGNGKVEFDFELIYFNSSSAKVIMSIFDHLDEVAESGADVTVNWHYDAEDDTMEELGQEFAEDLEHAKFNMKVLET